MVRTIGRGTELLKRRLGDFTGRIGDSLDIPRDLSYRESVLTAGLSIGAVGLIGAALAAGIGKFWRQPTGKSQSM